MAQKNIAGQIQLSKQLLKAMQAQHLTPSNRENKVLKDKIFVSDMDGLTNLRIVKNAQYTAKLSPKNRDLEEKRMMA